MFAHDFGHISLGIRTQVGTPVSLACTYARTASACIKTHPGKRPRKSRNLPDDMLAGAEPRSWNVARKWLSSLTSLPRKTTRPLYFRCGLPSGNSEPFSTQIPNTMPTCMRMPFFLASSRTSAHSRTLFSSHAPTSRRAPHSFSIAASAFLLSFNSFGFTDRATTAKPPSP